MPSDIPPSPCRAPKIRHPPGCSGRLSAGGGPLDAVRTDGPVVRLPDPPDVGSDVPRHEPCGDHSRDPKRDAASAYVSIGRTHNPSPCDGL